MIESIGGYILPEILIPLRTTFDHITNLAFQIFLSFLFPQQVTQFVIKPSGSLEIRQEFVQIFHPIR